MLNHVLHEVFCLKNTDENVDAPCPEFCQNKGEYASYHCLFHECPYAAFTSCENTLCYIGHDSSMEEGILFGGDMEAGNSNIGIDQWREIAIAKINEAYEEFMKLKKGIPIPE